MEHWWLTKWMKHLACKCLNTHTYSFSHVDTHIIVSVRCEWVRINTYFSNIIWAGPTWVVQERTLWSRASHCWLQLLQVIKWSTTAISSEFWGICPAAVASVLGCGIPHSLSQPVEKLIFHVEMVSYMPTLLRFHTVLGAHVILLHGEVRYHSLYWWEYLFLKVDIWELISCSYFR